MLMLLMNNPCNILQTVHQCNRLCSSLCLTSVSQPRTIWLCPTRRNVLQTLEEKCSQSITLLRRPSSSSSSVLSSCVPPTPPHIRSHYIAFSTIEKDSTTPKSPTITSQSQTSIPNFQICCTKHGQHPEAAPKRPSRIRSDTI